MVEATTDAAEKSSEIRRLEIQLKPSRPPSAPGSQITLRAILYYADGRTADATEDVDWVVQPELGRIDGNVLTYGCAASDLEVGADFVGEASGKATLAVRTPLKQLRLELDKAYNGFNLEGIARLKVIAVCRDGSESDVTCLAQTRSRTRGADVTGCGYLHAVDREKLRKKPAVKLEARYGGLQVEQTIRVTSVPAALSAD